VYYLGILGGLVGNMTAIKGLSLKSGLMLAAGRVGQGWVSLPKVSSVPGLDGMNMNNLWSQGKTGQDIAKFYIDFSNYFEAGNSVTEFGRKIAGGLAHGLYRLDEGLQYFYVHLFDILNINGNGFAGSSQIQQWYKWIQLAGTSAFLIVFLLYLAGVIFNPSGGIAKLKNIFYNFMLASFFIFALPVFTTSITKGVQSLAGTVLGSSGTTGTGKSVNTIAKDIITNNVIDMSSLITKGTAHKNQIRTNGNAFHYTNGNFSSKIKGTSASPFFVDLGQMSDMRERNAWSGVQGYSVDAFFKQVGSEDDLMNKDSLDTIEDAINAKQDAKDIKKKGRLLGGLASLWNGVKGLAGKSDGDKATDIFKYHIVGTGDTATIQKFTQFTSHKSMLTKPFAMSYTRYHINWINIFLGLIALALVLLGFMWKLISTFYQAIIMYSTSGYLLLRNADKGDKIKTFIRSYFGLFEMLAIDLVMLRLYFVGYNLISDMIPRIMYTSAFTGVANNVTLIIVETLCQVALFMAAMNGVDAVSQQLGQPTGHGQAMRNAVALGLAGGQLAKGVGNVAGASLSGIGKAGKLAKQHHDSSKHKLDSKNGGFGGPAARGLEKRADKAKSSRSSAGSVGTVGKKGQSMPQGRGARMMANAKNKASGVAKKAGNTLTSTIPQALGRTWGNIEGAGAAAKGTVAKGISNIGDSLKSVKEDYDKGPKNGTLAGAYANAGLKIASNGLKRGGNALVSGGKKGLQNFQSARTSAYTDWNPPKASATDASSSVLSQDGVERGSQKGTESTGSTDDSQPVVSEMNDSSIEDIQAESNQAPAEGGVEDANTVSGENEQEDADYSDIEQFGTDEAVVSPSDTNQNEITKATTAVSENKQVGKNNAASNENANHTGIARSKTISPDNISVKNVKTSADNIQSTTDQSLSSSTENTQPKLDGSSVGHAEQVQHKANGSTNSVGGTGAMETAYSNLSAVEQQGSQDSNGNTQGRTDGTAITHSTDDSTSSVSRNDSAQTVYSKPSTVEQPSSYDSTGRSVDKSSSENFTAPLDGPETQPEMTDSQLDEYANQQEDELSVANENVQGSTIESTQPSELGEIGGKLSSPPEQDIPYSEKNSTITSDYANTTSSNVTSSRADNGQKESKLRTGFKAKSDTKPVTSKVRSSALNKSRSKSDESQNTFSKRTSITKSNPLEQRDKHLPDTSDFDKLLKKEDK
jgi:hypothetical protein